jgi:heme A synthase
MRNTDFELIRKQFWMRQLRQFIACLVVISLLFLIGYFYKYTDLLGEQSRYLASALFTIVIAAFIGFSAVNWRCPVCGKYLGPNINRTFCRKCGTKLQ